MGNWEEIDGECKIGDNIFVFQYFRIRFTQIHDHVWNVHFLAVFVDGHTGGSFDWGPQFEMSSEKS